MFLLLPTSYIIANIAIYQNHSGHIITFGEFKYDLKGEPFSPPLTFSSVQLFILYYAL